MSEHFCLCAPLPALWLILQQLYESENEGSAARGGKNRNQEAVPHGGASFIASFVDSILTISGHGSQFGTYRKCKEEKASVPLHDFVSQAEISTWDPSCFQQVQLLQLSERNHGHVNL